MKRNGRRKRARENIGRMIARIDGMDDRQGSKVLRFARAGFQIARSLVLKTFGEKGGARAL
ncbi:MULTISPECIES: hypothetical protein [Pseudomonas]|uniref:Uncharacterized protein n=1 Tax=Pseudomonas eucalypticola TaxID=2599595 RepID=A0A7D5H0L2_9PSED|nr:MULTISPECIES: hypothetical protein [Pseudomonas]QKZ04827.1 hypothetical protein HWQ56_13915 [Pseudomonas eucalypticola]